MILPIPDMYPRADCARQCDPAIFGNDCETWRSTYTEKTPGMPQVLLIEQSPRAELLAHYHASDQFQIFIEGEGKLGAHVVKPVSVHYTNRYTGYGPIVATGEPIQYFVLRPSFDPLGFGQYLFKPELREKLRAHPGPKRVLMADVEVRPERALEDLADVQVRRLFAAGPGESDSGLLADVVELCASHGYTGPDPREGGGQVILVLQGSIVYGGREMGARSALAVTGGEKPVSFAAGAKGLQALLLQYPRRDGVRPMTYPH